MYPFLAYGSNLAAVRRRNATSSEQRKLRALVILAPDQTVGTEEPALIFPIASTHAPPSITRDEAEAGSRRQVGTSEWYTSPYVQRATLGKP